VELDAAAERIANGKEVPTGYDEALRCHCQFYRQYLLPCRHIFHLSTEIKVLTPARWEGYMMMFAECGMEVYETMGAVWVEEESSCGRNAGRASTAIQVRASTEQLALRGERLVPTRLEQLQQQLYAIYESMDQLNVEDIVQPQRMQEWVDHVQTTLASLTNLRAGDIASTNRP